MKKQFIQTIKVVVLALILSVGVNFALAAWTPAPASPPSNNTEAPINVGASAQAKTGSFWDFGSIGTSTNIFSGVASLTGIYNGTHSPGVVSADWFCLKPATGQPGGSNCIGGGALWPASSTTTTLPTGILNHTLAYNGTSWADTGNLQVNMNPSTLTSNVSSRVTVSNGGLTVSLGGGGNPAATDVLMLNSLSLSPYVAIIGNHDFHFWDSSSSADANIKAGWLTSTPLANGSSQHVCADGTGKLFLCGTVTTPVCSITSFSASPSSITAGGSSTLSWATTNCTSASISPTVGTVSVNNSTSVSPASTTTYTLTASGTGGPVTATATVTVGAAGPITYHQNYDIAGSQRTYGDLGTGSPATFTVPAGVTKIFVETIGAGGGASTTGTHLPGGGGGMSRAYINVTPGWVFTIAVGAPGTNALCGSNTNGGNTTISGNGYNMLSMGGKAATCSAAGAGSQGLTGNSSVNITGSAGNASNGTGGNPGTCSMGSLSGSFPCPFYGGSGADSFAYNAESGYVEITWMQPNMSGSPVLNTGTVFTPGTVIYGAGATGANATAGSHTWSIPAGASGATVKVIGGGAGGGGGFQCSGTSNGGGGGGAGGYRTATLTLSGSSYTVVVGAAGSRDTGSGNSSATCFSNVSVPSAGNGGQSSFSTITAAGGQGGKDGTLNNGPGAGGTGGTGGTANGGNGGGASGATGGTGGAPATGTTYGGGGAGGTGNGNGVNGNIGRVEISYY